MALSTACTPLLRLRPSVLATTVLACACGLIAPARDAHADNVSPDGKGIVGGALLGAEVVTIVEGIADVRSGWAYAIGAVVGAGGGAAGGYFIERGSSDGKVPSYMLAGGLALIIPAVVLTLNGTRYRPLQGAAEDNAPAGPPAEPGTPGKGVIAPPPAPSNSSPGPSSAAPVRMLPLSLVDVRGGNLRLGIPAVDVRPVFSLADQRQYGMAAQTELRMPMLHVIF